MAHWILRQLKFSLLSLLFLPPMICMAQAPSMTSTGSGNWNAPVAISNYPDILVSGGNVNAWHILPANLTKISSGNGCTMGVNSTGVGYQYADYPTNSWTAHTEWGTIYDVQCGGDGNIYALFGPGGGGCVNEGFHSLGRWNGSGWTQMTYCFLAFSMSKDQAGLILLIDGNNVLWGATGFGASGYAHYPVPSGYSTVISIAAVSASPANWYVVTPDNKIWYYNGSSYAQVTTSGRLSQIVADANVGVYGIGVGSDKTVYHYNGSTWDHLTGTGYTAIADGGPMDVWAVGTTAGGHNVYRLTESGVQFSRSYSGTVGCAPGVPQSLCNTFHHTSELQLCIGAQCGTHMIGQPFNGPGQWGLTATVNKNDIFDCFDNFGNCVPTEANGDMHCSGGGSNNDNPNPGSGSITNAFTLLQKASAGAGYNLGNGWAYASRPYCSNTNTPLWNPTFVIAKHTGDIAWYSHGWCLNIWGYNVCTYDYYQAGPYTGLGTDAIDKEYNAFTGDPGPWNNCTPQ